MYTRTPVPTDGSDHSHQVAERAITPAGQFGAVVHALLVVEHVGPSSRRDFPIEKQEKRGEETLDGIAALGGENGVHLKQRLRRQQPSDQTVDVRLTTMSTSS